jgi:hypothetical protein
MSEIRDDLSDALTDIDHKSSRKLPEARLSQNKVIWSTLNFDFQERLRPHLRSGSRRRRSWIDYVVYRLWIDQDHRPLTPTAVAEGPTSRMTLTAQLIHTGTVAAALNSFSAGTLSGSHEPDTGVAVLFFVPAQESRHLTGRLRPGCGRSAGGSPIGT